MSHALYNEIEPFAADWLERLVDAGHIAPGRVERRSIADLTPADVAGPGQRHFFAGIGGWSYALRLAGVPDDADVWTGSCPCQPFSNAGARRGTSDPRHLWPTWFALIAECRPPVVLGEQVAGPDGLAWLDDVFADLEGCGYACGAAVLAAGSVSAPHARHRSFFVAHADSISRRQGEALSRGGNARVPPSPGQRGSGNGGDARRLGDANGQSGRRNAGAVPGSEGTDSSVRSGVDRSWITGSDLDPWGAVEWIDCDDGRRRPVPTQPALFPLADGVPGRMGKLRGAGNAIVPQVAAAFIAAAFDAIEETMTIVRRWKERGV